MGTIVCHIPKDIYVPFLLPAIRHNMYINSKAVVLLCAHYTVEFTKISYFKIIISKQYIHPINGYLLYCNYVIATIVIIRT